MKYLIYVLPVWFGWYGISRYVSAVRAEKAREALTLFAVFVAVIGVTPAGVLWFDPISNDAKRQGFAVAYATYAMYVVFVSALLRLGVYWLQMRFAKRT